MICKQCNNDVPNDSEYCPFCGNIEEKEIAESISVSDIEKGYTYLELKEWKKAKEVFDFAIVNNDNKAKAYIGRLLSKLKLTDLESLSNINQKLTKFDDFETAIKYADYDYKKQLINYSLLSERKSKKKFITLLITSILIVVIFILAYFVIVPYGTYLRYNSLLNEGSVETAVLSYNSYKNGIWLNYKGNMQKLFYEKGVDLVNDKDYINAELCFAEIDENFLETNNYYNYCKAQNLLAENDLESYNYFTNCKDFLNSKEILNKNEYFVLLNKLQGEWYHPKKSLEEIDLEMKNLGFQIDESEIRYSLGYRNWVEIMGEYGYSYSERYREQAKEQTIIFSGTTCVDMGKIVINKGKLCVIGADNEIYIDKFIEVLDDESINFAYFKWEKK